MAFSMHAYNILHSMVELLSFDRQDNTAEHTAPLHTKAQHTTAHHSNAVQYIKLENGLLHACIIRPCRCQLSVCLQTIQKGVLIRRIEPTAPVNQSLKKGDILLSFDGVDIANDGTVPFRSGERISFNYLVSKKYTNEEVSCPSTLLGLPIS